MFTMIAAALGLLGTLAGIAWKWKAANSSSAADKAATAEAADANAMTKTSANVTDATRADLQVKLDANTENSSHIADVVRNSDGLQSGADALNAAIAAANRPKD